MNFYRFNRAILQELFCIISQRAMLKFNKLLPLIKGTHCHFFGGLRDSHFQQASLYDDNYQLDPKNVAYLVLV